MARNVAAVTIADLAFSAELGNSQTIKGSLGGLEVSDLTPESLLHHCILSVGDCKQDVKNLKSLSSDSECKAFSFSFVKVSNGDSSKVNINSQIASASYVHSADFLSEISLCAGDFREYAASAAKSIQTAAADAAKEFVSAKNEGTISKHEFAVGNENGITTTDGCSDRAPQFSVFVCIETPVIAIPRSFNSADLLIGNLGKITVRNLQLKETDSSGAEEELLSNIDRIILDISNVSMYSMTLNAEQIAELSNGKTTFDFLRQKKEVSCSTPFASPLHRKSRNRSNLESLVEETESRHETEWIEILHETGFQLIIDRIAQNGRAAYSETPRAKRPSFRIEGAIARAVKLELSSKTYNQVLETLNSLSSSKTQTSATDMQHRTDVRSSSCSSVTSPKRYFLVV